MNDAPTSERIWAAGEHEDQRYGSFWTAYPTRPSTPYVREDLHTALQARLAEVEAERDEAREENRWAYIEGALDGADEAQGLTNELRARAEAAEARVKELEAQPAVQPMVKVKPTDAQVASACLSYRHDFGLLPDDERARVMFQAREWLHAWKKELAALPAVQPAPEVAALVDAVRRKIALDTWERTVGGVVPEPLRGVDEALRAALAAMEGRG
jgi:hypothetical protein